MIRITHLTLIFCLQMTFSKICKKHIQNSLLPNYAALPTYDIREWAVNLNLQQCSIVEVGEFYSALFLEDHSTDGPFNFYLGMCDHHTMKSWQFCSPDLTLQRKNDCILDTEHSGQSRVHRRFCDIHWITLTQQPCNCTTLLDTTLYRVNGFPTCFVDPLPESLCGPLNACGLHKCNGSTILGRIHSVQCDPKCRGQQPFCEWPVGAPTAQTPAVYSLWSDWYELEKRDDRTTDTQILYFEAKCVNKYTYKGGIDCLGPGTSCCPADNLLCKCKTFLEDATLKVRRWVVVPIEHSTSKPKDYDVADDIVRQNSRVGFPSKNRAVPFAVIKRDAQSYEDDDEDEDIADEDIVIEEDRMTRKTADVTKKQHADNDDEPSGEIVDELSVDSMIKKGKIIPNKGAEGTNLRINRKLMLYLIGFHFIFSLC